MAAAASALFLDAPVMLPITEGPGHTQVSNVGTETGSEPNVTHGGVFNESRGRP